MDAPRRPIAEIAGEAPEPELEVDLFSLIAAFRAVLERAKQRPKVLLPPEQMPIEMRIEQLLARLSETEACGFEDLFADVQTRAGADRDVPGAARDDPAEADSRVPVGQLRADPRLQARAAGRRAAADCAIPKQRHVATKATTTPRTRDRRSDAQRRQDAGHG